jgi:anti-sigma factor RsiW
MPGLECVSATDLQSYVDGDLPERVSQAIARRLDACPDCDARVRRLDAQTDPFVRFLRVVFAVGLYQGFYCKNLPSVWRPLHANGAL